MMAGIFNRLWSMEAPINLPSRWTSGFGRFKPKHFRAGGAVDAHRRQCLASYRYGSLGHGGWAGRRRGFRGVAGAGLRAGTKREGWIFIMATPETKKGLT